MGIRQLIILMRWVYYSMTQFDPICTNLVTSNQYTYFVFYRRPGICRHFRGLRFNECLVVNFDLRRRTDNNPDIHEAVILKLRRLYGYEAISNFSEAVINQHEAVM